MSKKGNPISFAILCALLIACVAATGCKTFTGSSGPTLDLKVGMSWDEAQALLVRAGAEAIGRQYMLRSDPEHPYRTCFYWDLPNGTQIAMYGDKEKEQDALTVVGLDVGDSNKLSGKGETWYSVEEIHLVGKRMSIVGCDGNYLAKGMTENEARAAIERAGLPKADSLGDQERYLLDAERKWYVTVVYVKDAATNIIARIQIEASEQPGAIFPHNIFECEFLHLDRPMANWTRD